MKSLLIVTTNDSRDGCNYLSEKLSEFQIPHEIHKIDADGRYIENALSRAERINAVALVVSANIDSGLPDIIGNLTYLPVVAWSTSTQKNFLCPVVHDADSVVLFISRLIYPYNNLIKKKIIDSLIPKYVDKDIKNNSNIQVSPYVRHSIGINYDEPLIAFSPLLVGGKDLLVYTNGNIVKFMLLDNNKHITDDSMSLDLGALPEYISYSNEFLGIYDLKGGFSCWDARDLRFIGKRELSCNSAHFMGNNSILLFNTIQGRKYIVAKRFAEADFLLCDWGEKIKIFPDIDKEIMLSAHSIYPYWENSIVLIKTKDAKLKVFDLDKLEIWSTIYGWDPDNYYRSVTQVYCTDKVLGILGVNLAGDYEINLLETSRYKRIHTSVYKSSVSRMAIHPSKKELIVAECEGNISIINYETADRIQDIVSGRIIGDIRYSCSGNFIAMTDDCGNVDFLANKNEW